MSSSYIPSPLPLEIALRLFASQRRTEKMTVTALAAQRRLGVVSAHLGGGTGAKLVVVLPDGGKLTVLDVPAADTQQVGSASATPPTTTPHGRQILLLNGVQIASFVVLGERKVAFDAVALGTRYQGATKHIPKYNVVSFESFVDEKDYGKVWAWVYGLVMLHHEQEHIPLLFEKGAVPSYILESGLGKRYPTFGTSERILEGVQDLVFLSRSAFWQGAGTTGWHSSGWLLDPRREPFPAQRAYTRNDKVIASHPLRPPKPKQGTTLYRRWCGSVMRTLEITYFDLGVDGNIPTSRHMAAFHKWHNDERVNSAWGERGSLETHREYVESALEDPNVWPCMLSWDGELMGYVEVVWAKENHVGQHYPNGVVVGDWERGIHVLAGESKFVGSGMSETWIRSLVHYIYLADPRTERVIGEPDHTNKAILAVAKNSGFHTQTFFDFPYKRSAMVLNVRDSFFTQCRLY